jgi:glycerate dehydrogenase
MNIVILDGVPLNPGDLDWQPLRALGELVVYDHTTPGQLAERIRDAEIVLTNKVKIPAAAFAAAPRLKLISVLATGYDVIDLKAARNHLITVCNVPSYSAAFTAQTAIALLMELTHHVALHADAVRAGAWSAQKYFSFWKTPLVELDGKVLLLVGTGNIGSRVGEIANAFGMNVFAAQLPGRESSKSTFDRIPFEEGLAQADVISLHCPLTDQTRKLIDVQTLSLMKKSALLINTARGALVDEFALAEVLQNKVIAGYAADVLDGEPPCKDNPLLHVPNAIITPHLGWASLECRQRLLNVSVENVRGFLSGAAQNVVS